MVKNVEVAKLLVVEETVKRLSALLVEAANIERSAYGLEVPIPRVPAEVIVVVPVFPAAKTFESMN